MSKVKANTFRHVDASSDAITLHNDGTCTINGNVTLSGTVTGDNDTIYDDTNLRRDLNTLALQTAVDTNRKAYNLQNSFIDQFEDDTGIGSETTADRNVAGEFISSAILGTTYVAPPLRQISSEPNESGPSTSSWTGGGVTNDTYNRNWAKTDHYYGGTMVDYLWDLSNDFTVRLFNNDSSGDIMNSQWCSTSIVVYPDTSKAAGATPTGVFASSLPAGEPFAITSANSRVGWDDIIDNTYGGAGVSNLDSIDTQGEHNEVNHNTLSSPYNRTVDAGDGMKAVMSYFNSGANYWGGWQFDYDKSASTLTCKLIAENSRTTLASTENLTITNVPSSGRAIIAVGFGISATGYTSSTYKNGSTSDYSSYVALTTNATGTVVSTANTASSSRTKVSGTFLYKNASGTATIGTDLKIYFTCNGGTNWTEAASYTAGSDFSTGVKTIYLGETTCTAGTDVRYKAVWANQAAGSKVTEVHGVAINY